MPDPFGCHRVVEPPGVLPQSAWKLDNTPIPRRGETLVDVEILNVDSSSFRQMKEQSRREGRPIGDLVLEIVQNRGKLHNPATDSGGMLLGRLPSGERVATLVSLTLTPLRVESIEQVDHETGQIRISGHAILFERTLYRPLPEDFSERAALAVLDVAGAPAHAGKLCRQAEAVLLLGAGKAGLLAAAAIRRENPAATILAVDQDAKQLERLASLGLTDQAAALDAARPLTVFEWVRETTEGALSDLTFNLVNQPMTEGASILATRDGGRVCFFSMATSFARAALTAEGVARDIEMMIGSGYTKGWDEYALDLLRRNRPLKEHFERRWA